MDGMADLYRYFDADGQLLYVGKSLNAVARATAHRKGSHWWDRAVRMEIEKVPIADLDHAERVAIWTEKPKHNRQRPRPLFTNGLIGPRDDDRHVTELEPITMVAAAKYLGCDVATIRRHIDRGDLRRTPTRPPSVAMNDVIWLKRQQSAA